jgi:AcrR family transcriptional regulator
MSPVRSAHPPLPTRIGLAAERLLRRRRGQGLTMGALAREAGVSRATLYRIVGSRDALIRALAARGHPVAVAAGARERILAGCRAAFTRAGFDDATLEDIAREAGVAVATVYRHFKDKESVIVAFADRFGTRRALRDSSLRPSGDLRADLEQAGAEVIRRATEDLDLLRLMLLERLRGGRWAELMQASPARSLPPTLVRLLKPYVERGALRPGDPRRMAQAFAGMLLAFFARPVLDGGPLPDPEETARFITHVFLDGLSKRKTP